MIVFELTMPNVGSWNDPWGNAESIMTVKQVKDQAYSGETSLLIEKSSGNQALYPYRNGGFKQNATWVWSVMLLGTANTAQYINNEKILYFFDIFPILYYVIFSYRIFGCCNISTYSSFIIIR